MNNGAPPIGPAVPAAAGAPTPRGGEAFQLLKMSPRPALDGLSIGFIAKAWKPGATASEPRRTLTQIDLVEISLVTFPANKLARVQAVKRLAADQPIDARQLEDILRGAGIPKALARSIIASGFKSSTPDEDERIAQICADLDRGALALQNPFSTNNRS